MKLRRKISLGIAVALAAATLGVVAAASPALAAGRIQAIGSCGDIMDLRVQNVGDAITVTITIPSGDPSEVWSLSAQQQDYGAVTGGRLGDPVTLAPGGALPPLVFTAAEGGFTTTADFTNSPNLTHGFSYTATRSSPSPLTCTNQGFWTNPGGSTDGPAGENPTARPDAPPKFANETEVDVGTNDALLLMDQEMLDNGQGIPANNRFIVRVNGVSRGATAVQIFNDAPPFQAVLDVTFGGAAITADDTVTVQYAKPLGNAAAQLQDLEALKTASFGPVPITVIGGFAGARSLRR